MTRETRGAFFHGSREEVQPPEWSITQLASGMVNLLLPVEEITPEQAIEEAADWPAAQEEMRKIFARHPA